MEFVKVLVPGRDGQDIDVLLNRQRNGKVGEVLTLGDPGFVMVSVDLPGAEEKEVDVQGTTPQHPQLVEIQVG